MQRVVHISSDVSELFCIECKESFKNGEPRRNEISHDIALNKTTLTIIHENGCYPKQQNRAIKSLLMRITIIPRHYTTMSFIRSDMITPFEQMAHFQSIQSILVRFLQAYETIPDFIVSPICSNSVIQTPIPSYELIIPKRHELIVDPSPELFDSEQLKTQFTCMFILNVELNSNQLDMTKFLNKLKEKLDGLVNGCIIDNNKVYLSHNYWTWGHLIPGVDNEYRIIILHRPNSTSLTEIEKEFRLSSPPLNWMDLGLSDHKSQTNANWNIMKDKIKGELAMDCSMICWSIENAAKELKYTLSIKEDAEKIPISSVGIKAHNHIVYSSNCSYWENSSMVYLIPDPWDPLWNTTSSDTIIAYTGKLNNPVPILYRSNSKKECIHELTTSGLLFSPLHMIRLLGSNNV